MKTFFFNYQEKPMIQCFAEVSWTFLQEPFVLGVADSEKLLRKIGQSNLVKLSLRYIYLSLSVR